MKYAAAQDSSADEHAEELRPMGRGLFRSGSGGRVSGRPPRPLTVERVIACSIALDVPPSNLLKILPFCRVDELPGIEL